ncbi:MAG: ATP-binding protein [Candidatus Micrarchaeota archaeon]
MGITDFIKNIVGSGPGLAKTGKKEIRMEHKGIYIGDVKQRLALVNTFRIAESYPRVRVAPVAKWRWLKCDSPFYLDVLGEVNPHINISGSSGFGKSTLCKSLLTNTISTLGIPVTVLDVHNEFIGYVQDIRGNIYSPREVSLNVWELDGLSPAERISENIETFRRILDLGEMQSYNLLKCAESAYARNGIFQEDEGTWKRSPPTMRDLAESITLSLNNAKNAKNQSLLGLSKRMYSTLMCSAFSNKTTVPFLDVVSTPCDFTLGDLRSSEAQALFIETFLRKLYSYMLSQELVNRVGLYILIDEAHKVCISNSKGISLPGRLVAEGRKYGVGIITSNQMAKSLDRSIIGNSSVTFAFHQKEPQEEEYVSNLLAGGAERSRRVEIRIALRNLKQFEALVLTSKIRNPVKIRVKPIWKMKKTQEKADISEKQECPEKQSPDIRSLVRGTLEMKAYRLNELEKEIGVQLGEMEKIVRELETEKLVEIVDVNNLDGKMERWVGRKREDKSVEHFAYVAMLAELLDKQDIPRTVLDTLDTPDLVAEFEGKKMAVEYETGKKRDDAKTREMLGRRVTEYPEVIVVTAGNNIERYRRICSGLGVEVVGIDEVAETFRKWKELQNQPTHEDDKIEHSA